MDTTFIERRLGQLIAEAEAQPEAAAYDRIGQLVVCLGGDEWLSEQIDRMVAAANRIDDDIEVLERASERARLWGDASRRLRGIVSPPPFKLSAA